MRFQSPTNLWFELSKVVCQNSCVLIGGMYVPPEYTASASVGAISEIENDLLHFSTNYKRILLLGDLNARTAEEKNTKMTGEILKGNSVNEVCDLE